ncbi:MAG: type II/IV secretion system ATPase subunit [Candidatus Thermoplasmatota archaeon]|nr:type II/IV secretion system ATPase subunit [Candidatus Thermoplasmatota archaeon]MBU4071056.1 type II/IV secretion system ATPase subunit [Candidatus Thermoplasmatota archaeon]MBU4143819.1 type II/IV secretion system ATPase subunit [Candidatus Thermoplasmatota archaeon]MBU4591604.1 type II/IV secretion system ATPase subunit [Candidatus Thermoplasmatota archaeon]
MPEPIILRPGKSSRPPVISVPKQTDAPAPIRNDDVKDLNMWMRRTLKGDSRVRPGFAEAWIGEELMEEDSRLARYYIGTSRIDICTSPGGGETLYRITPREYTIPDAGLKLLYLAKAEFVENSREGRNLQGTQSMKNRCKKEVADIISMLARTSGVSPGQIEQMGGIDFLTDALLRHTVGLGILEYLLEDEHVQDIYIDAPADDNPIHVVVGDIGNERAHGKCLTNIVLSEREVQALVSRFRFESGRPFSEAMPVLETDMLEFDTRVTVVGKPLSPEGVAIALRRHSTEPWTLPKLINRGSINPIAAGLLSFLIDGRSTILVAGSRGAGKSSMLGALMLEFPLSQRILTIEDTLELPGTKMQELGYKVQSLFVQSAIGGSGDRTADDALRVSLRLGESAIVLGEVRGKEAKTLYEAMRSGSAGSAVLGTIHGNSPKSVFERIVYDLDIHAEAFSATDIVVICGLVRPGGRQKQVRRVTAISELVKDGEPGEFADLLVYDEETDQLVETDYFARKSVKISGIADQWGLTYEGALANIRARARMREMMVKSAKTVNARLLGPEAVVKANSQYWGLVDTLGSEEPGKLMNQWSQWFDRSAPYV